MRAEQLKGHLDLLLLSVLDGAPAHGYAVISRLRDRSDGAFDLPEGTVYPALHRLERAGLVASEWGSVGGRRRRVYTLTGAGAAALHDRRAAWASFASGVTAVVARGGTGLVTP
jgi:DNA-binding PadR family transcriptional regulator